MDVSSVSPPAPVTPVDTSSGPKPVQVSSDNSNAYQPPPKAPLPPGQGTRVDQIA
jgi:hypothetical protein